MTHINYIEKNKLSWNNRTDYHIKSDFYDLNGFLKGNTSLNDIELKLLGDISNKSILHLQCHFGQDTISENEIILTSHFAKANSQWTEITDNTVLVIFTEPHAYISPKHYDSEVNVPTWNYIAIHVYGKGKIITEQDKSFAVLDTMINNFEKEYKPQWDKLPIEYKTKMLDGIVAFQIIVTDIQAKKKLSQNKKETERQRIISAFEKSNDDNEKTIAELMKQNENKRK